MEEFCGRSFVPSGASTGTFEAYELRDNDEKMYNGKSVLKAVENINTYISNKLIGVNIYEQSKIDNIYNPQAPINIKISQIQKKKQLLDNYSQILPSNNFYSIRCKANCKYLNTYQY